MSTTIEKIARNLKGYRMKREMSQHQLSRQSGVSCCLINWLESGKRKNVTTKTLDRLGEALGMQITDFFHGKE